MPRNTSKKKQKIIPPDPTRILRSSTVLKGKAVTTDNLSLKDKKLYRLIKKQLTDDKGNKYIVEVEEEMDIDVEEPSTTTSSHLQSHLLSLLLLPKHLCHKKTRLQM